MARLHPAIARDLLVALACAVAFAWIAFSVLAGPVPAFDVAVRAAVHSIASPPLTSAAELLTNLGSGWFLVPVGLVTVYWLYRRNRRRAAALFSVALLGANALEQAMKLAFHRPRPEPFFDYALPYTFSFPSGHAFISFVVYLSLAEILIQPGWPRSMRTAVWSAAIVLTLAIGFTRVYLGVHHPSDVVAGFVGALGWTCIVRAAHRRWWHPDYPRL